MRRRKGSTENGADGGGVAEPTAREEPAAAEAGRPSKWRDLRTRSVAGVVMLAVNLALLWLGHVAVCCLVVVLEALVFRELLVLGYEKAKDGMIPRYRTLSWYYFGVLVIYVYGKSVLVHFFEQGRPWTQTPWYEQTMRHHSFIVFCMYCVGFVTFVLTLKAEHYAMQFSLLGRTVVALILVVFQAHFVILNIKQGMAWFVLPTALVICNDTFAYIVGRLVGRTSLIAISPKKTREGFIGAIVITVMVAVGLAGVLQQYEFMRCPLEEFTECGWRCRVSCETPRTFVPQEWSLLDGAISLRLSAFQLHAFVLGIFASLIAPFGGFFASGAKRAFAVKDFASLIPGHGGVTDRVDCQFLMAMFTYVYLINFVLTAAPDVGKLMVSVAELSHVEQEELFVEVGRVLARKGANLSALLS